MLANIQMITSIGEDLDVPKRAKEKKKRKGSKREILVNKYSWTVFKREVKHCKQLGYQTLQTAAIRSKHKRQSKTQQTSLVKRRFTKLVLQIMGSCANRFTTEICGENSLVPSHRRYWVGIGQVRSNYVGTAQSIAEP